MLEDKINKLDEEIVEIYKNEYETTKSKRKKMKILTEKIAPRVQAKMEIRKELDH